MLTALGKGSGDTVKKNGTQTMEILEAFDKTKSAHSAAKLAGCDPKTVRRLVARREAGLGVFARQPAEFATGRTSPASAGTSPASHRTPAAGGAAHTLTLVRDDGPDTLFEEDPR